LSIIFFLNSFRVDMIRPVLEILHGEPLTGEQCKRVNDQFLVELAETVSRCIPIVLVRSLFARNDKIVPGRNNFLLR